MSLQKSTAQLKIGNTIITNEDYEFSWKYQDKNDNNPSFLEISLPNLATSFQNKILKEVSCIFDFGFGNSSGTLINGIINKKEISFLNSVTEITNIKVIEIDSNGFADISKSYKNKKTSFIIQDIANDIGYIIKSLELKNDILQQTGYVAYGKGLNILKKLVRQADSNIRIEGNLIFIYDIATETRGNPSLIKFGTGLLTRPLKIEEQNKDYNYIIKSLANPNIRKNSIIKIETDELNSYCKVIELKLSDWVAEYFVKVLEV